MLTLLPLCVLLFIPTLPYLLSSSHDNKIKLWNWDLDWCLLRVFVGHSASVVHVTFNPKDDNTFASASLDNTTKCTLGGEEHQEGHLDGVLCVDYFTLSDKPYLITCSADQTAKVWDYQTKRCLETLKGHTNSVTAVCFHPVIPIIITVSEDATAFIWLATTFRLEKTLKLRSNSRCFAIGHGTGSYQAVFGCNRGPVLMEFSLEIPLASMDKKGTIVFAKHREIYVGSAADKGTGIERPCWGYEEKLWDFEGHHWVFRHLLTTCDFYPEVSGIGIHCCSPCTITFVTSHYHVYMFQSLEHSPDDRSVVVCGDGKYIIINNSLPRKVASSGSALEFVWSSKGGHAVKGDSSQIEIFNKNFDKKGTVTPPYSVERIFGGTYLAVSSSDFIDFYDWEKCVVISRVDVTVKTRNIYCSESDDLVAIAGDSSLKILDLNCEGGKTLSVAEDKCVLDGVWVMNCFIYITEHDELTYCVGGRSEATVMCFLPRPMSLMVSPANPSRVYLMDEEFNLFGYTLPTSLIAYQRLVLRGELVQALEVFPSIPEEERISVARFLADLEVTGYKCETLEDFAKEEARWIELGYVPPGTTFPQTSVQAL
ncbi:PREDICTED: coatomer subunit beta'-1-like isoform X4 [Camelina sativa]|uniref:Coatomer subunit beta'-1-like isoform X3 n=1 Tax=Camelina sativa TaxID=90675 RepID=A0ABM0V2S5_CAMSA|nr:PREDICTED: coatomer subunit beta'-1-like isoform X3 [Camelina sativa]XP_010449931.1 PREDICTED: coatomer subunit beta'-1-like isoform X4 [Camelina sativa]